MIEAVPNIPDHKVTISKDGNIIRPHTSLSSKERRELHQAGYEYSGRAWYKRQAK